MTEPAHVFDDFWFAIHQQRLLRWLNAPILGTWLRQKLGVDRELRGRRILRILPHAVHADHGHGSVVGRFYSDPVIAWRLRVALKPVWDAMHEWDRRVANPLLTPAWNLGFDTLDFYTDPYPARTKGKWRTARLPADPYEDWATIRAGAGTSAVDTQIYNEVYLFASASKGIYTALYRMVEMFDTTTIGSAATVTSATWSCTGRSVTTGLGDTSVHVIAATTVSNTVPNIGDHITYGVTSFGNIASIAGLAIGTVTAVTLSTSAVTKASLTKLGFKLGWDHLNTTPGTSKSVGTYAFWENSYGNYPGTTSYASSPYLTVVWTPGSSQSPSASRSPSASASFSPSASRSPSASVSPSPSPSVGDYTGRAWGESNPDVSYQSLPWSAAWVPESGGPVVMSSAGRRSKVGPQDYGVLHVYDGWPWVSPVVEMGTAAAKTITGQANLYGSGGTVTLSIRGSASIFGQMDASPSWTAYSSPVSQSWRYVQFKLTFATQG